MKRRNRKGPVVLVSVLATLAVVLVSACLFREPLITLLQSMGKSETEIAEESSDDENSAHQGSFSGEGEVEKAQLNTENKEQDLQEEEIFEETEEVVENAGTSYEEAELLIEELIRDMSTEEKVGQMFMARFPSYYEAPIYAEEYFPGGYVLFDVDFAGRTEDEVRAGIDACQDASRIPLLMAVDEEGGTVTRVSDYFRESRFRAPRRLYEEGGFEAVDAETQEKCELLMSLHLNMNLAPVVDMADDPEYFIYDRSFGTDTKLVSEFVQRTVAIMREYGVACSLKHFPGYGANLDTHTGMSIDERDASEFYNQDLIPFQFGIQAMADSIMVSHNIVTAFDAERPASLSPEIHQLARRLGFDGILITDDLAMAAVADYYGMGEAAVMAVTAGNDMLISSDFLTQYHAVLDAVEEGVITEERINESVRRILWLKWRMGLI